MSEGDKKMTHAGGLKPGSYVIFDGIACTVKSIQTSIPGKHGHAKCRIEAVGMVDGKKMVKVYPGHDNVEVPIIIKKTAQVLSVANDMANVMDSETFETFDLKIPEDLKGKVVEGGNVLYWIILSDKVMKEVR